MSEFTNLEPFEPAPWFHQRSVSNKSFSFQSVAGRYIVLCFFGSAGDAQSRAALEAVAARSALFDDIQASFFGVSNDPRDESEKRVRDRYPGYRFFWDFDFSVAKAYGAAAHDVAADGTGTSVRRLWVVLDPLLRVLKVVLFAKDKSDIAEVISFLDTLPPVNLYAGSEIPAPILVLPDVFEPALCQQLIGLYEQHGGIESGFMAEVSGRTVGVHDHMHKRRKDYTIADEETLRRCRERIQRRLVPLVRRVFQFDATRMERYIIACYSAEDGGHFRAHRDNTTKGTAHRRFAVSINLNSGFEGGDIYFPEFGSRRYRPPAGGAVVFSCSLLHAVSKVTGGQRYAFLPFLYDDEAARLRQANAGFLEPGKAGYKSGLD